MHRVGGELLIGQEIAALPIVHGAAVDGQNDYLYPSLLDLWPGRTAAAGYISSGPGRVLRRGDSSTPSLPTPQVLNTM